MNEARMNSTESPLTANGPRSKPATNWFQLVGFLISIALATGLWVQKIFLGPIAARTIQNFGIEASWIERLLLGMPSTLAVRIGVFALLASFACFTSRKATWAVMTVLVIANVATFLVLLASQFRLQAQLS
jgi:hypothetical protein